MTVATTAYPTSNLGLYPDFTAQYSSNLELLLQQKQSLLRPHVTTQGGLVGKMASPVTQYSSITMKAPRGRFSPVDHVNPYSVRPWMFPQPGEIVELIDSFDKLQTIVDPTSGYVQAAAAATGRYWDDGIISAAVGSRQIGTDIGALSTDNFSTSMFQVANNFGASATIGMTVAKIIEGRRILEHYHNDLMADPVTLVIGSQQKSDLLNQTEVVSTEFNDRPVLVNGQIQQFLGCQLVISERLSVSSSNRNCFMFVKSGLTLGLWKDMENYIDQRVDISGRPWQLMTQTMFGPVRTQNGKVISILCNDSTGVDITP